MPEFNTLTLIGATWSNAAGTMFLWVVILSLVQIVLELILVEETIDLDMNNSFRITEFELRKRRALLIFSLFYSLIIAVSFYLNAFNKSPSELGFSYGLTPSLRYWYTAIHPILSFTTYSLSIIPYVIFATGIYSKKILKNINIISSVNATLVIASIVTGGIWSFEVLWGGFWTWDPVENLTLIIFLSSILHYHVRNYKLEIQTASQAITFPLVLFASFIIRSGLLKDPHSYASQREWIIYLILFLISLYPFIKFLSRQDDIKLEVNDYRSIWIFSLLTIIGFMVVVHVVMILLVLNNPEFDNYPKVFIHYFVLTFILLPLIMTVLIEINNFNNHKYMRESVNVIFIILIFPIIFKFPFVGVFFISLFIIGIILVKKYNNNVKLNSIVHKKRLIIHVNLLLLIIIALNSYYTLSVHIITLNETQSINVEDHTVIMKNYELSINTNDEWELKVEILLDNEIQYLNAGWNKEFDYYSIPIQIYQGSGVFQIHLSFIANTVYSNDPFTVFLEFRSNNFQNSLRIFGYLLILVSLIPIFVRENYHDYYY